MELLSHQIVFKPTGQCCWYSAFVSQRMQPNQTRGNYSFVWRLPTTRHYFFYAGNSVVNAGASNSANANYEMKACVRWLKSGSSNMAVLEFNLLTGMEADRESLEGVSTESNFCFGKLVLLKPSS